MNIKDAKEQIKNAMTAYFTKDDMGGYLLPIEKQRPVFLMGPPGVGKTAVMEQIASEMGVGLLSYSMTHHTRQSALGLPFIVHKKYGDMECDVSEYTMSEIISSVYDLMESTGVREGILFLDEINCVSETLSPVMLQFLQYKVFGRHRVPDGWIVVTAGNPPEYNNSVREFDIVTWDRLKRVDIEPEFDCWKEYAYKAAVHPSVMTYLEIKKDNFYKVESTVDGKQFVTARGWDDLSRMITVYEKCGIAVDKKLIAQYIQNPKISSDFAAYYDLFNKYRSDYQIDEILSGRASDGIKQRARNAHFDERLSLIGLLLDGANGDIREVIAQDAVILDLMAALKKFKLESLSTEAPAMLLRQYAAEKRAEAEKGKLSGSMDYDERAKLARLAATLEQLSDDLAAKGITDGAAAFQQVKTSFDENVKSLKRNAEAAGKKLNNMFLFSEEVFSEGHEMLVIVTELTANYYTAKFISKHGCDAYFRHNQELLFFERQQDIVQQLDKLDLD